MLKTKIKEFRLKNNFTQNQMAESLNISQNAYCLIENGETRLIDTDRIKIIAEKLNTTAFELGLLDGLGIQQYFNEKVQNGYIHHIENLYADNKELLQALKDELQTKNIQLEKAMNHIQILLNKLK